MSEKAGGTKELLSEVRNAVPKAGMEAFAEQLSKPTMDDQGFTVPMTFLTLTRNIRGEIEHDEEFEALCESIKEYGQLQAVIAQLIDGKPTLIGGYRRYAAMQKIGLTHIRVTGKNTRHDWELIQVWENLHRSNLPPVRFCDAVLLVHNKHPEDTMEELARRIGLKDRGQVTFFLKVGRWPKDMRDKAHALGLSRRALVDIARQKRSNTPEGLEALLMSSSVEHAQQEEKKEVAVAPPPIAKDLRSRIDEILTDLPEKAKVHRKDFSKIANAFTLMQAESRRALIKMLRTLNAETGDDK